MHGLAVHCQHLSISISKKVKTEEGNFVPNESFPLEILPSIKNRIKRWTGAFQNAHPLKIHTLLMYMFLM